MKLTLDHTQRLNLHALLGAQRADVGSIRAIWAVQDKIALDADEEKQIELKREIVGGQERMVWNAVALTAGQGVSVCRPESHASEAQSRRGISTALLPIVDGWSPLLSLCSQSHCDGRTVLNRSMGLDSLITVDLPQSGGGSGGGCLNIEFCRYVSIRGSAQENARCSEPASQLRRFRGRTAKSL